RAGRWVILNTLMTDDVELFILRWRLKIRIDDFEVRVRCPKSVVRQPHASLTKLIFAQGIRSVYKVQLMLNLRTLDQFAKPRTLRLRIGGKIEHDGDTLRQESADVWRERVLQPRRALDESRSVGDLTGKQSIQ